MRVSNDDILHALRSIGVGDEVTVRVAKEAVFDIALCLGALRIKGCVEPLNADAANALEFAAWVPAAKRKNRGFRFRIESPFAKLGWPGELLKRRLLEIGEGLLSLEVRPRPRTDVEIEDVAPEKEGALANTKG